MRLLKYQSFHQFSAPLSSTSGGTACSLKQVVSDKMHQKIFDREGRGYDAFVSKEGVLLLIKLYDRHSLIGEARCVQESPDTLLLADISIANNVILTPANRVIALLEKIVGYQPKPINYRGQGIGSALLQLLLNQARTPGIRILYGNVFRQDLENNPKLLQWYKNQGLEIEQPASEKSDDIVAQVTYKFLE